MPTTNLHAAVIGAGPSGLSACRHLAADPERFTFACYEQCDDIGGTWFSAEDAQEAESDKNPTSVAGQRPFTVYHNLRSNFTTQIMEYPDYKFLPEHITEKRMQPAEIPHHFATQYDIHNYLSKYVDNFTFRTQIRLNEQVDSIQLVKGVTDAEKGESKSAGQGPPARTYEITSHNTRTDKKTTERFDAVLVCNGHYAKPSWPKSIKNLSNFKGRLMHCKYYRGADRLPASYKKIIIIGESTTGPDLAVDLAKNAPEKDVMLVGHNPILEGNHKSDMKLKNGLPTVVRLKPDVTEIVGPNSVKFKDDTVENDVDLIIPCTGFDYFFPFFDENLKLKYEDKRLQPLYKHVVHIDHPTLCFVGLHHESMGFQMFDLQARYALAALGHDFELPARADMLKWEAEDFKVRTNSPIGWPGHYAHRLERLAKSYHDALVSESGVKPLDNLEKIYMLFLCLCDESIRNPEGFRESKLPQEYLSNGVYTDLEVGCEKCS